MKLIPEDYFNYLYDLAFPNPNEDDPSYYNLLKTLAIKDFTWTLSYDENRFNDGLSIRRRYYSESHHTGDQLGPCSVLEMMLALAFRWDDEYCYHHTVGERGHEWFYEMLENLGLDRMTDEHWDDGDLLRTQRILDIFLNRQYDSSGNGGLFPLKSATRDQRSIDIWAQLMDYINEQN